MKHKILLTLFVLTLMIFPFASAPVASAAAPEFALLATNNAMVDIWVFVDTDLNGIYSAGDNGLSEVSACLSHSDWVSCVGTDYGDTWWEDLEAGDYISTIDPVTFPAEYQLNSIRCEPTGSRVEYAGCQYDLNTLTATYNLLDDTRINIFYALTTAQPNVEETSYVDIWAFVDADLNGIYSTGDDGLTDVNACLVSGDGTSCVGTDSGDTWWEDLASGDYVGSIDAATIPAGYKLQSIRCEDTISRVEYADCQYNLDNLTAAFHLEPGTRINIFFALTADPIVEEPDVKELQAGIFVFIPFLGR